MSNCQKWAFIFFIAAYFPLIPLTSLAQTMHPGDSNFQRGNQAFMDGDYEGALALYEKSCQEGGDDPVLYNNGGIAAYRLGDIGRAVKFFNKGLRLAPRDKNLRENLEIACAAKIDMDANGDSGLSGRIIEYVFSLFSLNELMKIFALFFTAFVILLAIYPWFERLRLFIGTGAIIFLILIMIISPVLFLNYKQQILSVRGVIIYDFQNARSGPSQDYSSVFTVNSGTCFWVKKSMKGWSQIILDNGYSGWIMDDAFERI